MLKIQLMYWLVERRFVGSEVWQASHGPVAISSKFGWLLSGPLNSTDYHNIVSTNLIVTYSDNNVATTDNKLVDTLKKFWEAEAISIIDISAS